MASLANTDVIISWYGYQHMWKSKHVMCQIIETKLMLYCKKT